MDGGVDGARSRASTEYGVEYGQKWEVYTFGNAPFFYIFDFGVPF